MAADEPEPVSAHRFRAAAILVTVATLITVLSGCAPILDGWLHGYLPLDASPGDSTLTTWKLGQFAEAHYRS